MLLPGSRWLRWRFGAEARAALTVTALCGAWFSCSALGNVVGKLLLTDFPRPLTVAMAQLACTALCSAPLVLRERAPAAGPLLRALLPLALAKFLTTLCSQVSIWKVPVSYAHTVKATTPLWTAGLAWALFGERQPRGVAAALVLIAAGVALASATEMHFDAAGLFAALAAAALLSLQHLYSKRLLARSGWSPLRILAALSALAALMFLPVWAWSDGAYLIAQPLSPRSAGLLLLDGVLAWLQAAAAFSVLSHVTPLTYAVLSCGKRVLVVAASLLLLRNPAPPLNIAGMALAAIAVFQYNRAKLNARQTDGRPLLPV